MAYKYERYLPRAHCPISSNLIALDHINVTYMYNLLHPSTSIIIQDACHPHTLDHLLSVWVYMLLYKADVKSLYHNASVQFLPAAYRG